MSVFEVMIGYLPKLYSIQHGSIYYRLSISMQCLDNIISLPVSNFCSILQKVFTLSLGYRTNICTLIDTRPTQILIFRKSLEMIIDLIVRYLIIYYYQNK